MCGAGRVYDEGLAVADICKVAGELDGVNEFYAGLFAAFDAEADDCAAAFSQVFLGQSVVGVRGQARVVDPGNLGLFFEPFGERKGVLAVPGHTQVYGFEALKKEKGVERRNTGAHIAEELGPS